jgi:hypothetical protein
MLRFAGGKGRPALRLLVLHDEPEREFDYVKGAEQALERAKAEGWTVVSVKNDWATVFAHWAASSRIGEHEPVLKRRAHDCAVNRELSSDLGIDFAVRDLDAGCDHRKRTLAPPGSRTATPLAMLPQRRRIRP